MGESNQPKSAYFNGLAAANLPNNDQKPNALLPRPRTQKELMPDTDECSVMAPEEKHAVPDEKIAEGPVDFTILPPDSKEQKNLDKMKRSDSKATKKKKKKSETLRNSDGEQTLNLNTEEEDLNDSTKRGPTTDDNFENSSRNKNGGKNEQQPLISKTREKLNDRESEGTEVRRRNGSAREVDRTGSSINIVGGQFLLEGSSFKPYRILPKDQWEQCENEEGCQYIVLLRKDTKLVPVDLPVSKQVSDARKKSIVRRKIVNKEPAGTPKKSVDDDVTLKHAKEHAKKPSKHHHRTASKTRAKPEKKSRVHRSQSKDEGPDLSERKVKRG